MGPSFPSGDLDDGTLYMPGSSGVPKYALDFPPCPSFVKEEGEQNLVVEVAEQRPLPLPSLLPLPPLLWVDAHFLLSLLRPWLPSLPPCLSCGLDWILRFLSWVPGWLPDTVFTSRPLLVHGCSVHFPQYKFHHLAVEFKFLDVSPLPPG